MLTENDLVFVTNGSCTEGTIYGDQNHAPNGDAEVQNKRCLEPLEKYCPIGGAGYQRCWFSWSRNDHGHKR